MTRRSFLTIPIVGSVLPVLAIPDSGIANAESNGFIATGELQAENEPGYYTLNGAEAVSLMLSPDMAPSMVRAADALVRQQVEIVLRRKL